MSHGPRLSAPHLLVVDADPTSRTEVAAMLVAQGARVTTAGGADEALRHVTSRRFDAAVVDHALPGVGGVVVVAQLRCVGNGRDLPAVVLHGLAPGAERERAAGRATRLPGVAFIGRPVTGAALASAVNRLTAAARLDD